MGRSVSTSGTNWFKVLQLPSYKKREAKLLKYHADNEGTSTCVQPKPFNLTLLYRKGFAKTMIIGGEPTKVLTLPRIAKIYPFGYQVVISWYHAGNLPPPFMLMNANSRNASPVWLVGQIAAWCRVVNMVIAQGYKRVPWSTYPELREMIKAGSDVALQRYQNAAIRKEFNSKQAGFNVVFIDGED